MSDRITYRQHSVKSEEEESNPSTGTPSRSAEGEAFSTMVVQIFRLNGLLLSIGDTLAGPAGQTSARWRTLAAVEERPLTVAQIARVWGLARQSVQRVADLLVRDGLAVYEENPKHRRAQLLALTPKGLSVLRTIQSAQRDWANSLGAEIGEADLHRLNALLSRVQRVVEEHQE